MSIAYDTNTTIVAGNHFEESYIALRKKEGRFFSDEELAQLPDVVPSHPLKKEWAIRKASCLQLVSYFSKKANTLNILEVGCGNGWLSNQLSKIKHATVVGIDVNAVELNQAQRIFGKQRNVNFFCGDLRSVIVGKERFDVIVFAASIQYFPSLPEIINAAFAYLKTEGEIHILDSHFYANDEETKQAKNRSDNYFALMGFEEMSQFYFHHCLSGLAPYNYKILDHPNTFFHKLFKKYNPFHWICIRH